MHSWAAKNCSMNLTTFSLLFSQLNWPWLSAESESFLGLNDPSAGHNEQSATSRFLNRLPKGYHNVSAVFLKDNLAVIPGEWDSIGIKTPFYDIKAEDACFRDTMAQIKAADFIAWDASFFDVIGPTATIERIQSFSGQESKHVHEAPAYVLETNELLFSDTTAVGWLWAINVDTHETRKLKTSPPLHSVNGASYRNKMVYVTTNGSPVRGIYSLNVSTGEAELLLNNYRGRHFNSPNDLVFDRDGNIWFTDPPYGWFQKWPGVQAPEVPTGIYFFNTTSKALVCVSNSVVHMPNGLAFSPDGRTFYVADSSTSSGRPMAYYPANVRNIWAFDVNRPMLSNPRLIYQSETGWPDGVQVTQDGLLLVTAVGGLDVVDPRTGALLGKVNTPDDIIFNVERGPMREGRRMWLLTGHKFIYKMLIKAR